MVENLTSKSRLRYTRTSDKCYQFRCPDSMRKFIKSIPRIQYRTVFHWLADCLPKSPTIKDARRRVWFCFEYQPCQFIRTLFLKHFARVFCTVTCNLNLTHRKCLGDINRCFAPRFILVKYKYNVLEGIDELIVFLHAFCVCTIWQ